MKMSTFHYKLVREAMSGLGPDASERERWDALFANIDRRWLREMYEYLNDANIDTGMRRALRSFVREN